jgi:predicted dehydrogenase
MPEKVAVALVGAGGFGQYYANELLHNHQGRIQLDGVIDPYIKNAPHYEELRSRQIPLYTDLSDFVEAATAQLVCIASPIQFHASQTILALEHGASVLCEKPLCATIQDALRMAQAAEKASGFTAIGYQWSFSAAIQSLKADILNGALGRPVRLKSRVYWPRTNAYYSRNKWAGRTRLDDGSWVLDSPAGNAAAHYLHNMLYVLGATRETSTAIKSIQAELYRVNPIENYDTGIMRCITETDVEILFYTTHATQNTINPIFDYEFENAVVRFDQNSGENIIAYLHDGRQKNYGNPFAEGMGKIWQCVEAVRTGQPVACGIQAAIPQVRCINGAQESAAIVDFPESLRRTMVRPAGDTLTYVEGLEDLLTHCYEANLLPSESDRVDWATAGKVIDLRGYDHFPYDSA